MPSPKDVLIGLRMAGMLAAAAWLAHSAAKEKLKWYDRWIRATGALILLGLVVVGMVQLWE